MNVAFRCLPEMKDLLPPPVPAVQGLPDWLRSMPAVTRDPLLGMDIQTAKRCPPFVDAMGTGFLMPLPCDVRIADGQVSWDWDLPATTAGRISRSPVTFHTPAQAAGSPFARAEGGEQVLLKFNCFWTIATPPGWSLLCLHPLNRPDLPFETVSGLVNTDSYGANFINFVARWTDPTFDGVLPKGTPVAQCVPVRRDAPDLDIAAMDGGEIENFTALRADLQNETGVYRRHHRRR